MQMLKVIALLLEYPEEELWEDREALCALVAEQAPALQSFADRWLGGNLLDRQSEWCETFDRGCATSLLLFEHVHGESRDRGQAMVDLMSQYEQAGLLLNCRELPDYLPLYLEYLSLQPQAAAQQGLQDVAPILALIGGRLRQRESVFSQLFDALLAWAGSPLRSSSVAGQVSKEPRDDTREALDAVWEEAQIKFIDDRAQGCGDTSPEKAHQQRFQQQPIPQYLDLSAGGPK
ncbi:nitrate reductase molybdenum cofactor assembly chaperone [Mixta intestinalis]|jgi:nitrate reductase delta subunit|uniref:Putative nitrate reductase molybdenum cofactor assembly chaperone NarW n=1 Tax=Mixta intestinalis TaxID=1615494 RepID=A0A6P1PWQ1_9GAMM|nr:nitrate reductase molybdenum cofactor assembly chaperone [Mixta intestinalis]QHM70980.1 putative nitrate reductase molybdenum cofactor assembly chaperone NarW [Mixta intestinalis]